MKKIFLLLALAFLFVNCEKENESFDNSEIPVDLLAQLPNKAFDHSAKGLYIGIFSTFDTQLHGKIVVNVGNDGNYNAIVALLSGEKLGFTATNSTNLSALEFEGNRGSFTLNVADKNNVIATNVIADNKDGYIVAYKARSSGIPILAFGTYVDSSDPAFNGNWDMVNTTGATDPGVPFTNYTIEDIIISHPGGYMLNDDEAGIGEAVNCVFPSAAPYLMNDNPTFKYVDAQNQQSRFNGVVTNWGVFYGVNGPTISYSDGNCQAATSGTWSRLDRSGTITITDIGF